MSVFMNMTLPPTCTRHPGPFLSSPNPMATINLLSVLIVHINGVKQHVGFWSGLFYLPERFWGSSTWKHVSECRAFLGLNILLYESITICYSFTK